MSPFIAKLWILSKINTDRVVYTYWKQGQKQRNHYQGRDLEVVKANDHVVEILWVAQGKIPSPDACYERICQSHFFCRFLTAKRATKNNATLWITMTLKGHDWVNWSTIHHGQIQVDHYRQKVPNKQNKALLNKYIRYCVKRLQVFRETPIANKTYHGCCLKPV